MTSAAPGRAASSLPTAFDDFEIVRPLGAGGMGTVYLARDRSLDRLVAIKLVASTSRDRHAHERFLIEAKAIARLQHPNVVALYRIGQVEQRPYLAYEFVPGRPLDLLPRPAAWQWMLGVALGIARGLAAAHARGVLHRDIKPANVLVSDDGDAKLIDFGLARLLDDAAAPDDDDHGVGAATTDGARDGDDDDAGDGDRRLTAAGSVVGTPLYLAPELWTGAPATERTDIYALGVLVYEMLCGALPHGRPRGALLAHTVLTEDAPPLGERAPAIPRPLAALVDRCVRRDPADRPAAVREIRDELEALASVYRPFFTEAHSAIDQDRVRASFERIAGDEDRLVRDVFERWMAAEPDVRSRFGDDLAPRRAMVVTALKLAIDNLQRPERLVPLLEDLGRRHAGRRVEPRFFGSMGRALLAGLEALDPGWDEPTAAAWSLAYTRIAQVVQRGVEAAERAGAGEAAGGRWELPLAVPPTAWAQRDGADLAYQVLGHGPIDLVILGEWVTHVELAWRQPALASLLRQLASIGRVIVLDRRGTGLSDRDLAPSLDAQVDDVVAVLDDARCDRAVVLAIGDAAAAAATLAATRAERVRALLLYGAGHGADDPARLDADLLDEAVAAVRVRWGTPLFVDRLAPSVARDADYRAWWAELVRHAATPRTASALLRFDAAQDVRAALGTIATPTLVVHRKGDRFRPLAGARRWAAAIPGAQLAVLAGDDHAPWVGDRDALLACVHDFVRAPAIS